MSDKPPGTVIAAVIAAPLMVVCCLFGPAAIAWLVAGASGWVASVGATASAGLAIIAAILVFAFARRRRAKPAARPGSAAEPMLKE